MRSTEIQKLIDEAPDNSVIRLPPGTHTIDETLYVSRGVQIHGATFEVTATPAIAPRYECEYPPGGASFCTFRL